MYRGYLEDFNKVKLIISNNIRITHEKLTARSSKSLIDLKLVSSVNKDNVIEYFLESVDLFDPHLDYEIFINEENICQLYLGSISQTELFDEKYYFNDWLGYKYTANSTRFRVWSPVSKEMYLVLNDEKFEMVYLNNGIWELEVEGDLDYSRYHYLFRIDKNFVSSLDPYAVASVINHQENYVIDPAKTYQMKHEYYQVKDFKNVDAIIYELNIRDATSLVHIKERGTYKALTASVNKKYGLGHIKKLGVTHIQLMPVFAFDGVDESIHEAKNPEFEYNWGYNPMQYNVPSGFFSTDPYDPYVRINELKELIDTIHLLGMGVNMDVVYNHVYDAKWFPIEKLVPGYTFRTDSRGFLTNASWCGNDVYTNHSMMRKFIIDSLVYYQNFYKIDGFRFDLMGLIDIKTINQIDSKLKEVNKITMLYGEGWNMGVNLPDSERAHMGNHKKMPGIGFFNDCYRNTIRGKDRMLGYCMGSPLSSKDVCNLLKGYFFEFGKFNNLNQSIQYFECHDNYTFVDLLKLKRPNIRIDEIVDYVRLAFGILLFSQGVPFIHAGSTYLRTKKAIDNSYNLSDDVNGINWHYPYNVVESVKDLIKIRKQYSHFKYETMNDINKYIVFDKYQHHVSIRMFNEKKEELQLIISNNYEEFTKYLAPGTILIYDGIRMVNSRVDKITVERPGVYLLKK